MKKIFKRIIISILILMTFVNIHIPAYTIASEVRNPYDIVTIEGSSETTVDKNKYFRVKSDSKYKISDIENISIYWMTKEDFDRYLEGGQNPYTSGGWTQYNYTVGEDGEINLRTYSQAYDPLSPNGNKELIYYYEGEDINSIKIIRANPEGDPSGDAGDPQMGEPGQYVEKSSNTKQATLVEKILTFFLRMIGKGAMWLIGIVAGKDISIDALIFNNYPNTKLAFFKETGDVNGFLGSHDTGTLKLLSDYFNMFRNIALLAYMLILIYMGIRVMLMSTAGEKSRYKQLMVYWVEGIIILFFFPYVMRYTIQINNALVSYIGKHKSEAIVIARIEAKGGGLEGYEDGLDAEYSEGQDYMSEMYKKAKDEGWAVYAICWLIMIYQLIAFLIIYFKRVLMTLFLIAIFPFVTISYALDKVGDGKSQAFGNWFKEYILNVFVQTFHAINYVVVMGIIFEIGNFQTNQTTGLTFNWVLILVGITYISKGDKILMNLFGQKGGGGDTVRSVSQSTAQAIGMSQVVKSTAQSVKKSFSPDSSFGKAQDAFHKLSLNRSARREHSIADEYGKIQSRNQDIGQTDLFETLDESSQNIEDSIRTALDANSSEENLQLAVNNLRAYSNSDNQEIAERLRNQLQTLSNEEYAKLAELMDINEAMAAVEMGDKINRVNLIQNIDLIINARKSKGNAAKLANGMKKSNTQLNQMKNKALVMGSVSKKKPTNVLANSKGKRVSKKDDDTTNKTSTDTSTAPDYKSKIVDTSEKKREIIKSGKIRNMRIEAKSVDGGTTQRNFDKVKTQNVENYKAGKIEGFTKPKFDIKEAQKMEIKGITEPQKQIERSAYDVGRADSTVQPSRDLKREKRKFVLKAEKDRKEKTAERLQEQRQKIMIKVTGAQTEKDLRHKIANEKLENKLSYERLGDAIAGINSADGGDFSYRDISKFIETYKKESARDYTYSKGIADNLRYNIDEFETNWAVETLLNTKDIRGTEAERQELVNKAIDVVIVNKDRKDGVYKDIIAKLEKEIPTKDLIKGKMPIRKYNISQEDKEAEDKAIQSIMNAKIEKPYDSDLMKLKAAQYRYELAKEGSRAALGALFGMVGLFAGAAMGAGTSDENNIIKNVSANATQFSKIGTKIGKIPSRIISTTEYITDKVEDRDKKIKRGDNELTAREIHEVKMDRVGQAGESHKINQAIIAERIMKENREKLISKSQVAVVDKDGRVLIRKTGKDAFGNDKTKRK